MWYIHLSVASGNTPGISISCIILVVHMCSETVDREELRTPHTCACEKTSIDRARRGGKEFEVDCLFSAM